MHEFEIPPYVVERVMARRGRLHAYESLDPGATALVVIDMQGFFLSPGVPTEVPKARDIVPNINRLANAVRRAGGPVVWVRMTLSGEGESSWPSFFSHVISPELGAKMRTDLGEGSAHHRLWPDLDARPEDLHLEKTRFSAFIAGASDIEARLRGRGIDTVLMTGTLTNVCCESSARDAMMLGFKVVMVSDANAARHDTEHAAALITFIQSFGDVRTTEEVIGLLAAAESAAAAAAS
ncbi:MAG: isochorismatase family protein [Alphaproteobacteria bacterium]